MMPKVVKFLSGTLGLIIGFLLLGTLVVFLKGRYDKGIIERHDANRGVAARDTAIAQATAEVARRDTIYLRDVVTHREIVSRPESTKPEIVRSCNAIILSCDQRIKASDVLADSLRAQVEALREMKERKPPRLSAFAEGGYDLVHKEPVARAGGEMRVIGPFSLVLTGEATLGLEESRQRVIVSGRFTFR